jgi:AcrR family transcriptional regulator
VKAKVKKAGKKSYGDILDHATQLFARLGYHGLSMRELAAAVGVSPAALYHHFKNKDELYIQVINRVFEKNTRDAKAVMADNKEPTKKLEAFIIWFVGTLNKDKEFRKLLQWVMLDSDTKRLQKLTKTTFSELFSVIQNLGDSFKQHYDPQLLSVSIVGLILYHFESSSLRKKSSKNNSVNNEADAIAKHITTLLENGLLTH